MNPSDFPRPVLIPVNGVELEVFEAGRHNAGKPIVLCHGWPEHAYSWRYQVPAPCRGGLPRHRPEPTRLRQFVTPDRSDGL